jgi:hypothetical protein
MPLIDIQSQSESESDKEEKVNGFWKFLCDRSCVSDSFLVIAGDEEEETPDDEVALQSLLKKKPKFMPRKRRQMSCENPSLKVNSTVIRIL